MSLQFLYDVPGYSRDPVFKYIRGNRVRGTNSYDPWGTYILFPEDAPAAVPLVTPENQVIKDVAEWKKYVKIPDLAAHCSQGWEDAIAARDAIDPGQISHHDRHGHRNFRAASHADDL